MTRRVLTLMLALLVVGGVALYAADLTAKWTAKVPGRGGEARDTTFVFKQEGAKLSGTMSGRDQDMKLEEGKVDGATVTFVVNQSMGDNAVKITFKGTISGDEIKFTRQREGGQATEFAAKRAAN